MDKKGRVHPNFLPAMGRSARKAISRRIRSWRIAIKNANTIQDLSKMYSPELSGWYNYYGRYYPSAMYRIWEQFNWYLVRWVRRKYKKYATHKIRAIEYVKRMAKVNKRLFVHWTIGIF